MATSSVYKLHVYDHCPYCSRVELLMSRFEIPYERVVYGYGEGADPAACDGEGYGVGPVRLTGKKLLPVLQGEGVPVVGDALGMGESLEICSYLVGKHGLCVPPASGRADVASFSADLKEAATALTRPRIIKMPVKDWQDRRDADYARWKYTTKQGFDYSAAEARTPDLVDAVNAKLATLEDLIRGEDSLNSWGFGMDDIILLPSLRLLTAVKGIVFPPKVKAYMAATLDASKLLDYTAHAC